MRCSPESDYPTTFSPRHFYRNLGSSYESHLPPELAEAINILKTNLSAIDKFLSFERTILFCASSVPAPVATPLLSAIENATSGCIKKASDIFSNNALWYLFYRNDPSKFRTDQSFSIEKLLLDAGCNPHHLNCIGLDYAATAAARQQLQRVDMC